MNSLPHGEGTLQLKNQDRYTGLWKAGHKHGQGNYYYANGELYKGDW